MSFERTEEYMLDITLDALDSHVVLDAKIRFIHEGSKLKAHCPDVECNLQFPRKLRRSGKTMVADVVKAKRSTGKVFYRAYPGSIRETKEGDPVA